MLKQKKKLYQGIPGIPTKSPFVRVRRSKIHGTGVFARTNIPKGAKIIEYVGEKVSKKEATRRSELVIEAANKDTERGAVYLFELDSKYDIDGNVPWNTARYINHSCAPNCESVDEDGHIWIIALRDITPGEELVYNYGYDVDNYLDHPCKCGSKRCVGFIVEEKQWPKLFAKLAKGKR